MSRPTVAVGSTGGTITMTSDEPGTGVRPSLGAVELLAAVPGLSDVAEVTATTLATVPSGQLQPVDVVGFARWAAEAAGSADGVVLVQGTDTIEETAYLLDRSLPAGTPVVITGAMRNSSELSWDGPANLMSAVEAAASPDARGRGTMVVMDEEIVQGAEVVKTHTEQAGTFRSPNWGPLGITDKGRALFYRESRRKPAMAPERPVTPVDLIKIVAGADARLVEASLDSGAHGIVLEALGRGNVPPAVVPGIRRWIDAGKPVIVASRSQRGRVLDTYAYEGGGHQLREMGAIFADHLSGQQARIELMLALGLYAGDVDRVRATIEGDRYEE